MARKFGKSDGQTGSRCLDKAVLAQGGGGGRPETCSAQLTLSPGNPDCTKATAINPDPPAHPSTTEVQLPSPPPPLPHTPGHRKQMRMGGTRTQTLTPTGPFTFWAL